MAIYLVFLALCILTGPLVFIACPVAFAVSAGVTEGKNVKDIKEGFEKGKRNIENMRTNIQTIGDKTNKLVEVVVKDKERMVTIQDKADDAARGGRITLKLYKPRYFDRFQDTVNELLKLCRNYLQKRASDVPRLE